MTPKFRYVEIISYQGLGSLVKTTDHRLLMVNENKIDEIKENLHWPGIEPGPSAWQARILPLNHQCSSKISTNT